MHRGEGGLSDLVVYFVSEGNCSAKYKLCHNNRERLNSYNYVVTVYVNTLNHTTSSQRAKGEPAANRTESSRLGQWVTWGQAPAADFSWKPALAFPHVCWWCKCSHVCWLFTVSYGLWVKHVLPAGRSSLWKCPGQGRWEQSMCCSVFELR